MDLHVDLIKGGMDTFGVSENALFMPGRTDPQYSEWLAFSGNLRDTRRRAALPGLAPVLPAGLSARHRLLQKFGYSDIQAYMILGAAPIEGRLSASWTFRTRARRSTSPPRSSISTCAEQGRATPDRTRVGRPEGRRLTQTA